MDSGIKQQLLLIEDDVLFAERLARSFSRHHIQTHVAYTGQDALNKASSCRFDFALVDLHLETDSSLLYLTELRRSLQGARIVILTGYSSLATAVHAGKLGADDYLAKPADLNTILQALRANKQETSESEEPQPVYSSLNRLEWEHIQRALHDHNGNISATARALNIHRRTLQRKLFKKPVTT